MNGMLVVQKGNVIFEKYYNGHGLDDAFHVASVTKDNLGPNWDMYR